MTKKLTVEEKIAKILEYCKEAKDKAKYCKNTVVFTIELESTERTETEVCSWGSKYKKTEVYPRGSKYTNDFTTVDMLRYALKEAVIEAQQESEYFNNWFTVRVWIKTFLSYKFIFGYKLIDEEALNDYEITFKGGVEV